MYFCTFSDIHKRGETHLHIDHKLTFTVLVIYMVIQGCMSHFFFPHLSLSPHYKSAKQEHLLCIKIRQFEWIKQSPRHPKGYL